MNNVRVRYEQGKLKQEVYVGRHHLVADEPVAQGGEDLGPSPFEYVAAGLAACTAITLRMYAQRKTWALENAEVTVSIEKKNDVTIFLRKIDLIGTLSSDERKRLLEIASHCPVHKALTGQVEVQTALIEKVAL